MYLQEFKVYFRIRSFRLHPLNMSEHFSDSSNVKNKILSVLKFCNFDVNFLVIYLTF